MASDAPADGYTKLSNVLKPIVQDQTAEVNNHTTASNHELLIAIMKLDSKIDQLQLQMQERKKPVTREKKTQAAPSAGAAESSSSAKGAPAPRPFNKNKLIYFRNCIKEYPEYREKFLTKDFLDSVANDEQVNAKPEGTQRNIVLAGKAWVYYRDHDPETFAAIKQEYEESKAAHEAEVKPPQQQKEPHTP